LFYSFSFNKMHFSRFNKETAIKEGIFARLEAEIPKQTPTLTKRAHIN